MGLPNDALKLSTGATPYSYIFFSYAVYVDAESGD